NTHIVFEPTSVAKSRRAFTPQMRLGAIDLATPTLDELRAMHDAASSCLFDNNGEYAAWFSVLDSFGLDADFRDDITRLVGQGQEGGGMIKTAVEQEGLVTMAARLLPYVRVLAVKLGAHGVVLISSPSPNNTKRKPGFDRR